MKVFECIVTNRAVRSFRPDPLPEDVLVRILEAGRMTQSAVNRQPWEFIVIKDKDKLRRIAELSYTEFIAEAPLAVAIVTHLFIVNSEPWHKTDGARAIQSMTLAAWDEGVGSCWIGRDHMNIASIKKLLHIPEDLELLTVIPFGYPKQKITGRRKRRKSFNEIVHWETYGRRKEQNL